MIKVDMFSLSIGGVVIRFFLMMAIIIAGVFTGMHWLTILGLPIFLSALMGVKVGAPATAEAKTSQIKISDNPNLKKAS